MGRRLRRVNSDAGDPKGRAEPIAFSTTKEVWMGTACSRRRPFAEGRHLLGRTMLPERRIGCGGA